MIPKLNRLDAPPDLEGEVVEVTATAARAGDRPWWVRGAIILAVVPGIVAVIVLLFVRLAHSMVMSIQKAIFAKTMLGLIPGRSPVDSLFGRLLSSVQLKINIDLHLGRARDRVHTAVRVRTHSGVKLVRIAFSPDLLALSPGDEIAVWGRAHSDGVLRAFEVRNRTTSTKYRPAALPASVAVLAMSSIVLVIMMLGSIGGTSG